MIFLHTYIKDLYRNAEETANADWLCGRELMVRSERKLYPLDSFVL